MLKTKNRVLPNTKLQESTQSSRNYLNLPRKFARFCVYYGKYVSHSLDE
ncbi:MAG: hypothetical protein WA865_11755 [Spirulinaceae cyanobacterium]